MSETKIKSILQLQKRRKENIRVDTDPPIIIFSYIQTQHASS